MLSIRKYLVVFYLILFGSLFAQQPTQNIRGKVIDNSSQSPLPFANVVLLNTNPIIGTTTDNDGNFTLKNVPIGRYDLKVSYVGYQSSIIREIQVSSAKEVYLVIPLKEDLIKMADVVITPSVNKENPLNSMATLSARMLSVDEASRYAGGFDDPARLAAAFAGVASNIGNNSIVVRGNSPQYLQWKLEGIEIPNPNHFADLSAFGGGGLTALSVNMLSNSDFLTGAFPAEYGNALSGVFDIFMRNGSNQKNEHSFQVGLIGIEAASEGPFIKEEGSSSYLFNYRYSTLALLEPVLPENAGGIKYQDLSFKLNFPTNNYGTFSIWGIGLLDASGQKAKLDSSKWEYNSDKERQDVKQYMGASGISHIIFPSKNTFIKTTLAAVTNGINLSTDKINSNLNFNHENKINNNNWNFVLKSFINHKFSVRHTNKTGFSLTGLSYNLFLQQALVPTQNLATIVDDQGFTSLLQAYSSSRISLTANLTMNLGIHSQFFTLNNHYTIEPRLGLKIQINSRHSIGLAYGLHSRLERINFYFTKDITNNNELYNKNLDFTKAHHIVLGYDVNIARNIHLKLETYYQKLFNVPVIADSSFSFINLQNDWFFNHKLVNAGAGENYGLDITLEKYLTDGFYYLLTASVFSSKYKGGDKVWRNTRYNRNYLFNFLAGKEWYLGSSKANVLGVSVRFSYQGGDHYSPVNESESVFAKEVVFDETRAFSKQLPSSFNVHFTVSYKINKPKNSYEFAFKIINANMAKEFTGFQYNYIKNRVDEQWDLIFIPNLSLKINF